MTAFRQKDSHTDRAIDSNGSVNRHKQRQTDRRKKRYGECERASDRSEVRQENNNSKIKFIAGCHLRLLNLSQSSYGRNAHKKRARGAKREIERTHAHENARE